MRSKILQGVLSVFSISFLSFISLTVHAQACSYERVFTQTDKNIYIAGETIWFKSYVYTQFAPDDLASVLFIDLVDQHNKVLSSGNFPVSGGAAFGNIEINGALAEGAYTLKAYIKKEKNVSDSFYAFVKHIYVYNMQKKIPQAADSIDRLKQYFTVFPNSGSLVAGVKNDVFFTMKNAFLLPLDVKGEIMDTKNDTIASFNTSWNGIGKAVFIPQKDQQYTAVVHQAGGNKTYDLGAVATDRVAVDVRTNERSVVFQVSAPAEMQTNETGTVYGIVDRNIIFQKDFKFSKDAYSVAIPTTELPASVLDIVVTGSDKKKVIGYRSVFVNAKAAFGSIQFKADTLDVRPGKENVFTLRVPDSMMGNISIAVTDYDKDAHVPQANIFSDLLMQHQESASSLSIPAFFNVAQDDKINLLLATTVFDPKAIMPSEKKNCAVIDSNYISATGTVISKKTGKPVGKGELKVIFSNQDSGFNVLMVPIESDGRFRMNKMVYEGMGKYKYELNSKKSEEVIVKLDSVNRNTISRFTDKDLLPLYGSVVGDAEMKKVADSRFSEVNELVHTTLAPVTVTTRKIKPVERVNDKYTKGLFQNMAFAKTFDFVNDPPLPIGGNILDYLMSRIGGVVWTPTNDGSYSISSNRQASITGGPAPVLIYLNEQQMTPKDFLGIRVNDVAMVKYFPPGTHQITGQFVGVLVIYTRKWDDYAEDVRPGFNSFSVKGFAETKDFNTTIPDNKIAAAENRTTLYWNPLILLDKEQRSFTFRFPASASSKRLYVKVQGFTPDGKLIWFEKLLE